MGRGKPKTGTGGYGGHKLAGNSSGFGALNLPESPVFYPTEEEFRDPLCFIEKIRAEAEPYGICRIVPPKSWKPPFARDAHSFSFPTKLQAIHQLQERPATCDAETFELEYGRFLEKEGGRKLGNRPVFQGQEMDLCKLFNAVKRHGGFDKVVEEKKWGEVLRIINPSAVSSAHFTSVLSQLYDKHLYGYEIYQMCLNSGKRMRKWKRGTKRAAGESISAPQGNHKGKRRRKLPHQSGVCNAEDASPLKDAGRGGKPLKEEDSNLEKRADQICEQCQSGLHEELMLLCDRCDRGWHIYCLSPPLETIPAGNWYCLDCLNCERESFGFSPGHPYSLDAFRRLADRFKRKWFGTTPTSHAEIERRFWEIVEGSAGVVEVMYGSDLDTSSYGSGFPRSHDTIPTGVDPKVWQEYAVSPWNLNNFPKLQGSMLRLVHENIAGVMVPWLYIGMLFSSFCWHFEDHCFYSINYLHWGEPKCWYSVPGSAADAFEQVMRKTFPDLFEAQPDLLFQLVTMLNPTVLQGNGVPVCTALQEPGNFVITFPRSFHAGFNCGLNCAEAVNFAPADWLPHGGFGVELYRLYHKPAVLSHEELLYVVAKSGCCTNALPFLKEELARVINKERTHREQLWKNGIVRISRMTSRKHPEYVGTEEDWECIICRYYLHLSAVVCNCRPGASVCLQHAERLCECDQDQQHLLYRYSLAELDDLLLMGDQQTMERDDEEKDSRVRTRRICAKQSSTPLQTRSLVKKVKRRHVTHIELAEAWLTSARNLLHGPFSQTDISDLLEQAEQFLWAGHEMDPVRSMEKDLIAAQKWAQDVTDCLKKIESWMHDKCNTSLKVPLNHAQELIKVNEVPCIEPGFTKLKAMVEDANMLEYEIRTALSSSSTVKIKELEDLYSRAGESPFDLVEAGRLQSVIVSAKVWLDRTEECLSGKKSHSSPGRCCDQNINMLYDLKAEGSCIPILLPEMDLLEKLIQRVETWQGHARELLKAPLKLEELELVLQDAEDFHVSIPELHLLRQYKCNTLSWIERCHDVLSSVHERKDYTKAVEELTSILTAGRSLIVQVEELDIVELELRKFLWREKASKALARRLPLKILEELINEVSTLQLPNEKLVDEVSMTIEAAHSWEQSAKNVLHARACISEFEAVIRKSAEICASLPSLSIIKAAVSAAETWLGNAKPFLDQIFRVCDPCNRAPLRVDVLQELIDQSNLLKVSMKEPDLLRAALKNVESWRSKAAMLQAQANLLLKSQYAWDAVCDSSWDRNNLMLKLEELIAGLRCAVSSGLTLGFEFDELTKLKNVSAALTWNLKALSFSSKTPSIEDVESLISDARNLPIMPRECKLLESALLESKRWLMKAFKVLPGSLSQKKCSLQDLEELLAESQKLKISFPIKVRQIEEAISNQRTWQKQVHLFFNCKASALTWPELLQLKEAGQSSIVEKAELEMLNSRIADIGSWILRCKAVVGHSASSAVPLQDLLVQIKDSLDRALRKFQMPNTHTDINDFCICNGHPSEEIENIVHCMECKDRYHCSCLGLTQALARASRQYMCPFCTAITSGTLCYEEAFSRVSKRNRPTLHGFIELLNEANGLCSWVKEIELVERIVDCAKEWQSHLRATISHSLVQQDKNSGIDLGRLVIALKTIEVVEIEDQESSKLEEAVSMNCWRNRAKALLDGPTKPHFRHIRRVLKEGLSMNVPPKDYFLQELRRLERTASQWSTRAKQVVADHGALELDEVYKFIAEGERLTVDFSKELEALKVRSVLYCICRKPYDEDRAMIACDRCSEWYHFDCINLPEPDSSDEGCELLLQQECGPTGEFICPVCKPPHVQECSNLTPEMDNYDSEFTSEEASREGDGVATPFDFVRGKRRSRPTGKARSNLQERLKGNFSSSHLERSKMPSKDKNQPENLLTASGRPCRRTAGQHSKFESFVLLMHSR